MLLVVGPLKMVGRGPGQASNHFKMNSPYGENGPKTWDPKGS